MTEEDGERAASTPRATQPCSSIDQQPITEEEAEDASTGEREGGDSTREAEEWGDSNAVGGVRVSEDSFKPPSGTGVAPSVDSKVSDSGSRGWLEWRVLQPLHNV